jgi:glycosyltransferase involved in cell wall biosynthesis
MTSEHQTPMKICIVMPTYNGMKFLPAAIESVLAQTHQDWQLLISDDGSRDGTRDYLQTLTDPRITVYLQEKNKGIFGNLNFMFEQAMAVSPITHILCQDDVFVDADALQRCAKEWAQQAPEIAFIRFNHCADGYSSLARFESEALPAVVSNQQSDLLFYIFGCIPGNLSNVSLRTQVVKDHGWFRTDLPYAGDFEFWSRVGAKAPWAISKTRTTKVSSHAEQASATLNKRGELLPQLQVVLSNLYTRLAAQGHSTFWLRCFGAVCYLSMHRSWGVTNLLKTRSWMYLNAVNRTFGRAPFTLGAIPGWLIFVGSAGGRLFRVQAAKHLLHH